VVAFDASISSSSVLAMSVSVTLNVAPQASPATLEGAQGGLAEGKAAG
jgi:hypothetical protein